MHAYFILRGHDYDVKRFINDLSGKYLPFKWDFGDGKVQDAQLQLAVRPIQFYEVAFPEEHKDLVLNTIFGNDPLNEGAQNKGLWKWLNFMANGLRKILGLEPIGEYKKDNVLPVWRSNLSTIPIGLKKDYTLPNGSEGI